MNCKQAKQQISLEDFIPRLGIQVERHQTCFTCLSPLRHEKNKSFLFDDFGRWKDLGANIKGIGVVDLTVAIYKCSISEALLKIQQIMSNNSFDFSFQLQKENLHQIKNENAIKKLQPLQNVALSAYLKSRCIPIETAKQYSSEIYLTVNRKNYFYIAFKNDLGGFELRNKYMKSCYGRKDLTTISKTSTLSVFEGFFDYLSALVLWPEISNGSTVILNSVSLVGKAIEKIKALNPKSIELYLDNDPAGQKATKEIMRFFPSAFDRSIRFRPFNDVNDFLTKSKFK